MTHTTSTRSLDDNKIIVGINKPQISLKPGETAKCEMTLINGGPTVDTLMITVIGLPASWVQVIQEVALKKGEPHKTDLVFCPPNSAECRAGEYSVVIAVRSTDRPDDIGTATLTLTIQPVLSFTAETAVTTQRSGHAEATYSFNATNSGNTHANIDFSTSSDNRALHLALVAPGRPSQTALSLPLEPGVTQLLRLNVQAPIHWIGRLRSHQARVRASVSGHEPKLLTFNFDQSALIPPIRTWAITGGLLLLAGIIALFIYWYRIQSPKIVWNVQPKPLILNESFSIGVTVPNAKTTNLKTAGGQVLATANGPVITYTGIATMPLTLIVVGENIISMDQASVELPLVNPTPQPTTAPILTPTAVPPTPVITLSQTEGMYLWPKEEQFLIEWDVRDAAGTEFNGSTVDPSGRATVYSPGTYTLIVYSKRADEKPIKKTFTLVEPLPTPTSLPPLAPRQEIGGLKLTEYCQNNYSNPSSVASSQGSAWFCDVSGSLHAVDMADVCQTQYGAQFSDIGAEKRFEHAYEWRCYGRGR